MKPAPVGADEARRLSALRHYDILDTPAEAEFDDFTKLASQICGTPIALISLVDAERQWFKSNLGLDATETARDISFCGHAIHGQEVFEVPNTLADARFSDNPLVTSDPSIRFYAGAPLVTPGGFGIGTLCVIDRVPHQLSAEQREALAALGRQVVRQFELRRARNFLASVLSAASTVSIIATDAQGLITVFNVGAERQLGYSAAEMVGQQTPAILHKADEAVARGRELSLELGRPVEGFRVFVEMAELRGSEQREWTYLHKDGHGIAVSLVVTTMRGESGEILGYLGIAHDISERKRVEQMKTEFVSTVSHELRTPLTSIAGALDLLIGGAMGELPAAIKPLLEIASKNSLRLTHLINDLLDMEKIAAGKMDFDMQVMALMPLVEQALQANAGYGEARRVRFELVQRLDDVEVRVDSQRLQQVLANFLSNAAKYSPEGDQVEVTVERRDARVRVSLRDHGPGIPDEFRGRIFQRFAQADSSDTRQKGGTGLGLAITKELVEHMDGTVGFDSVAGEGARFWVELPIYGELAQAKPDHAHSHAIESNPGAPRILVVEDDADIAHLLTIMLSRGGYRTVVAGSGEDALVVLNEGDVSAMTLDLMLPGMSGLEVIRLARQNPATIDLPIIVVSARIVDGRLAIDGDFSSIGWLPKPINEDRLLSAMRRLLPHAEVRQLQVLHVEDDTDLHRVVRAMAGPHFDFRHASNLVEARAMLGTMRFDLVLLDLSLADGSGWDLLPLIRAQNPSPRVIVLSGSQLSSLDARRVDATLLKSYVSPRVLLEALNTRITASGELLK